VISKSPKSWTVLLYIAADVPERAIRQAALNSLEQMRMVGSSGGVDLAAQADLMGNPTQRYYFPQQPDSGCKSIDSCIQQTVPDVNSGSKQAFRDFLAWGTSTYPARKYMTVCWGHGYALDDYNPFSRYSLVRQRRGKIHEPALAIAGSTHWPGTMTAGGISEFKADIMSSMPDFSSKSVLLNREIGEVLREVRGSLPDGQQLEVFGMDACNMAMAEIWYEMIGGASIVVGSEHAIPSSSWPYHLILTSLGANPAMEPSELAAVAVDRYAEYYSQQRAKDRVTLSACDLRHTSMLVTQMKALVKAMHAQIKSKAFRLTVFRARNRTFEFGGFGLIDLCNFCELLKKNVSDSSIAEAAENMMQAIHHFAFAKKSKPYNARAKGLAIYFPRWIESPDFRSSVQRQALEYLRGPYGDLKFVRETAWGDFLLGMLAS
jgi:hypothetical protein